MNGQTRHFCLEPYPRKLTLVPALTAAGHLPQKRDRVVKTFSECNFSFILSGTGEYLLKGRRYTVEAPCILLQWPGEPMDYGPQTWWDEYYFIYPGSLFSWWRGTGVFDIGTPVRPMANPGEVVPLLQAFCEMAKHPEDQIDGIDFAAFGILQKSGIERLRGTSEEPLTKELERHLSRSLGSHIGCQTLAEDLHASLSTLRRLWQRGHREQSFSNYRDMILLQKSCRLLVESDLAVKEIAQELGFSDPFYFSRKFHKLMNMPPLEYRKKYR